MIEVAPEDDQIWFLNVNCGICDKKATSSHVDFVYFYGEDGWRYVENDGPVRFFCDDHERPTVSVAREKWLDRYIDSADASAGYVITAQS